MEKNERKILEILRSLCYIFQRKKSKNDDDYYFDQNSFVLYQYKIKLNFIYNSVSVVITYNNTFNVIIFHFNGRDEFGIENVRSVQSLLSIIDLPPDLIINKLTQIGVKEVW